MSTTEDRRTTLQAARRELAEPFARQYREMGEELEELDARRAELAELRRETLQLLRYTDPDNPEWAPKKYGTNGKHKPKPGAGRLNSSLETQDKVAEWLRAHSDNGLEDGIYAGGIMKHPAVDELGLSRATIQTALKNLAERGVLRLDRVGVPAGSRGTPAHIYKLTS